MGGDKTFVFTPEANSGGGLNSILAMIPGMLKGNGLDPNLVAALMNGNKNQDAWGGGGSWWIWIILLFFLFGRNGWGNNGENNGCNGIPAQLNNETGRELLMNAIQGNGTAISQLASSLNCSVQQLQTAICGIQGSIQNVGNQVGMTSQQIINAVQAGNCQIGAQIAQCCCDVRTSIERQGYENQLTTVNQTNTLTLAGQQQTNVLSAKIDAQTTLINDKFCQLEMREMQNKIDSLRAEKAALEAAALSQAQTANIVSQIRPCPVPAYLTCNPFGCNGNNAVVYSEGNGCGC